MTVRILVRLLQRILILALGVFAVWLIVFVFRWVDRRTPSLIAISLAYGFAAYVVMPRVVRMSLKVLQHQRVPRYAITGDGLPGDPVNLVLVGDFGQLRAAFASAGWSEADRLSLASSWRMARSFVLNTSYPTAPFSSLYLFGRRQDIGFQKAIGGSPRKRHHVRFWGQDIEQAWASVGRPEFWLNKDRPSGDKPVFWVGAGTKDTGLSLTRLTFQITHATDSDADAERDHIIEELLQFRQIVDARTLAPGQAIDAGRMNHYVTDGNVALATLGAA
jgi:LssY C-terminus